MKKDRILPVGEGARKFDYRINVSLTQTGSETVVRERVRRIKGDLQTNYT